MLDLKQLYKVLDYSYTHRDKPPGESVCIVIVPPSEVTEGLHMEGKETEDRSPHHVTVLYLGSIPVELEPKIKMITEGVAGNTKAFNVSLANLGIFENDEHDVYHAKVKGKKLHNFRDALRAAFSANQIMTDTKHPEFVPHMTLEYVAKGEKPKYIEEKPKGKWRVENIWLWGLSEPHLIFLK